MTASIFYAWWQLCFCAFAVLGLLAIYWHIGRKQGDHAQIWLTLSVLCWSISGGSDLLFQYFASITKPETALLQSGSRSILSLFNSLFILMALPGFRYLPKRLEPIVQTNVWWLIIGLPFLFSLLPTISAMASQQTSNFVSQLDVYYAILTLALLGSVLWTSFLRRGLTALAYLSIFCILITFTAQLLKLTNLQVNEDLFSAIFKSCLIMLFFALALSWVKELMEQLLPEAHRIKLTLSHQKMAGGRTIYQLQLGGIDRQMVHHIVLSKAHFELLHKFSKAKLDGSDWLEIRPKNESRTQKQYDIKDYNEIKRLMEAILDGVFGKGAWTKNHHFQPLQNTFFERSDKRDRKIRLRVPIKNIKLQIPVNQ